MGYGHPPLFKGVLAVGTHYVGVPIHGYNGAIGLHIAWKDATSDAAITLEVTDFPATDAPTDEAGDVWEWVDTGEAIEGPTATAAGATFVHLDNVRSLRARLVIVASADSDLEIYNNPSASAQ